jgi:phosphoenolpyruvate synthase/pyruvate phosphate dikinase
MDPRIIRKSRMGDLLFAGECPTAMHKAAFGEASILLDFKQANDYLDATVKGSSKILVTPEVDWSWTRILAYFDGVITDKGSRISHAAEVLMIMDKPGALGTGKATEILESGTKVHIVCNGNEALVYRVHEKPR